MFTLGSLAKEFADHCCMTLRGPYGKKLFFQQMKIKFIIYISTKANRYLV